MDPILVGESYYPKKVTLKIRLTGVSKNLLLAILEKPSPLKATREGISFEWVKGKANRLVLEWLKRIGIAESCITAIAWPQEQLIHVSGNFPDDFVDAVREVIGKGEEIDEPI